MLAWLWHRSGFRSTVEPVEVHFAPLATIFAQQKTVGRAD
jgi:hypothetical protein